MRPRDDRVRIRAGVGEGASLCDALDRLLDTGVVVAGDIKILVADVELLYVSLELVASSWETARRASSWGRGGAKRCPGE